VVALKPFADRTAVADSVQAMIGGVFGAARQIRIANVIAFNLPPTGCQQLMDFRRSRSAPRSRISGACHLTPHFVFVAERRQRQTKCSALPGIGDVVGA
jgi:hypothetical protein